MAEAAAVAAACVEAAKMATRRVVNTAAPAAVAAVEMEANAVEVQGAATEVPGAAPEARLVTVGAPEEQAAAATACTMRCGTRRLGRARV